MMKSFVDALSFKGAHLQAKMIGYAGHTGRGWLYLTIAPDGHVRLNLAAKGIAGMNSSLFINNRLIASPPLANGRTRFALNTRKTGALILASDGERVELRQHDDLVLYGDLERRPLLSIPKGLFPAFGG